MIACAVGLAAIVLIWLSWQSLNDGAIPSKPIVAEDHQPDAKKIEDEDERFHRMAVGTWEDEYQGKRTMTLNEDGTGTMIVELSGWRAALSAPRLKFNMKWSVEGGHLKKQTVSGEPEAQVKMILKHDGRPRGRANPGTDGGPPAVAR